MASYNTGFAPTLVPPLVPLPVFHPAASIPFSFACPPNPSTSAAPLAGSSSASSSRHASLQARRLPRGPPPPASSTARRPRTSRLSGAVERRDVVSGRQGSQQREHLRHEHEGGLERLLEGRAPLGVDLAAEKRDLSEEEQDEEYRVRLPLAWRPSPNRPGPDLVPPLSRRIKPFETLDIHFSLRLAFARRKRSSTPSCVPLSLPPPFPPIAPPSWLSLTIPPFLLFSKRARPHRRRRPMQKIPGPFSMPTTLGTSLIGSIASPRSRCPTSTRCATSTMISTTRMLNRLGTRTTRTTTWKLGRTSTRSMATGRRERLRASL